MSTTSRPNVVLILPDQIRAAALSCYGEPNIKTPHVDRLAQEGVRFTNMVASSPVCTPFRSMMLTGRHPQTTGHVINFIRTRHDEIGIGDAFSHAGYRTGYVGKWHLHTGSFPKLTATTMSRRDGIGSVFSIGGATTSTPITSTDRSISTTGATKNGKASRPTPLIATPSNLWIRLTTILFCSSFRRIKRIGHPTPLRQRRITTDCPLTSNYLPTCPMKYGQKLLKCTVTTSR